MNQHSNPQTGRLELLQYAGFVLLLFPILATELPWSKYLFWPGQVLTLTGAVAEIRHFRSSKTENRELKTPVFALGMLLKLGLIVGIALRYYDQPYSVFILLGTLLLVLIWVIYTWFFKQGNQINN